MTSSMISFPTHRLATGTPDRTTRSTIMATVYAGCVSHTRRMSRGTRRSATMRSLSGGGVALACRRLLAPGPTTKGWAIAIKAIRRSHALREHLCDF